jgi:Tfp pilus assembly protein PilF
MDHDTGKPLDSSGRRRWRTALIGIAILLVAGAGLWAARSWCRPSVAPQADPPIRPPEDPRLSYAGPFRTIHPDVSYVGDSKCAECHQDKAHSYRFHPMGHSLLPISEVAARQRYDAATHNPFETLGALFQVERQGEGVLHKQIGRDDTGQTVYDRPLPVAYVLGSGARGHSYLTERDGYIFQTPISWYSQKQIWDKSPGFSIEMLPGRPVSARCLFCHANRARARADSINRFDTPVFDGYAIGCERCHGPGSRHVENPGHKDPDSGADYSIVNPHHLQPELRASVCEQCHLAGAGRVLRRGRGLYDFRPGLPLEAFWSVFVRAVESEKDRVAVGHVEQMYLSQCFLRSQEMPAQGMRKLGCTSCHDPHQHVEAEQRVAHYRQRCLTCHHSRGCSVPAETRILDNKEDSCIDCHMPRYLTSDIAHTAATDHRILRRADRVAPEESRRPRRVLSFVPFRRERLDPDDRDAGRDLGLALVQAFAQGKASPEGAGAEILGMLEDAVQHDPGDTEAQEGKALVLTFLKRPDEALAAYEAVLARAPNREISLARAAMLTQKQRRYEQALSYWRRTVAENPYEASYRASLAQLLARQKAWSEARPHSDAWLRLDPGNVKARMLWVSCLLRTGEPDLARTEFEKIKRLRPANLPLLEARFAVESRAR